MTEEKVEELGINASIGGAKVLEPTTKPLDSESGSGVGAGTGSNKTRLVLYAVAGVAILCIVLWLIIGRVEAYSFDADNDQLRDEIEAKDKQLAEGQKKIDALSGQLESLRFQVEGLNNKNAQLYATIQTRDDTIVELHGKVAEKEVENDALRDVIAKLNATTDELRRKIAVQDEYIAGLKDDVDQLYSDMRLVVGITNQELNRNQALEKEIQSLEDDVKRHTIQIGQLTWELMKTKGDLHEAQVNRTLSWIGMGLAERAVGRRFVAKKIYSATPHSCVSKDFYDTVKTEAPNLFIATELSTGLIFGGYTEVNWTLGGDEDLFKNDPNAFTFSGTFLEKCTLIRSAQAINTARRYDMRDLMLTFGNRDISIYDQCLSSHTRHSIQLGKNYMCPTRWPKYFYTNESSPLISSFEFYSVKF